MSRFLKIRTKFNHSKQYVHRLVIRKLNQLPLMRPGRIIILFSTITATLITLGVKQTGGLEQFELLIYDRLIQMNKDDSTDDRFLTITITEDDLETYGWPISDRTLSNLFKKLQAHNPRVIGLDLYRNIPHPPGGDAVITSLQADNIIVVKSVGIDPDDNSVPAPPSVPFERVGFNDFIIDNDGIVRRSLLFVDSEVQHYSFALKIGLMYLFGNDYVIEAHPDSLVINDKEIPSLRVGSGGYQSIDNRGYQTLATYYSRSGFGPQVTLEDVLLDRVEPEQIRDRIILIGTTATSINDIFYTPYSSGQGELSGMPGVILHQQIVKQVIEILQGTRQNHWFLTWWSEILWIGFWCGLSAVITWYSQTSWKLILFSSLSLSTIFVSGIVAFNSMGWIPVFEPTTGFVLCIGLVLNSKIQHLSLRDSLTGLLNRKGFLKQLQSSLEHANQNHLKETITVIFFDLDHFKFVNESLGHQVGDRILQDIVRRIDAQLPFPSQIARVGGDEFAIFLEHHDQDDVSELIQKIRTSVETPIETENQSIVIKASLGVAFTTAHLNYTADDLLRDAHTAMYRAKSLGRDRYEVFAAGMHQEATNRLEMESELRKAIDEKTFFLHYQPIFSLQSGQLSGFEALVRWRHHKRGIISPQSFIPIAEESGLIIPLGFWIFREACRQLEQWHTNFPQLSHLTMSINLSGRQVGQSDLIEHLSKALSDVNVSNEKIRVEITETMLMSDVKAAIDLMLHLKELGLKLAIDDFGTGYSSLSYLHRFPIDYLKVDKSFIGQMEKSQEDYEIVRTIITLGHTLGMDVVAEGLETQKQRELLTEFNCGYGQGYLFSKPLDADDISDLLMNGKLFSI
ncbi:MAG: EAL domain-containing protein [Leptolyngbyaceae bacterium]|nr:EAL domain-containing protein [Leptolyngbyaceae bacterium]